MSDLGLDLTIMLQNVRDYPSYRPPKAELDSLIDRLARVDAASPAVPDGLRLLDDDEVCACLDETGERRVELRERCIRCNALHFPDPAVPDGLDEAWKAAEAALPEGWTLEAVKYPDAYARELGYAHASAWNTNGGVSAGHVRADGPTPAAALRALASRLTPQEPEDDPSATPAATSGGQRQ